MKPKVKALFKKWELQGLNLSKEEIKEELRRRGIQTSCDIRNRSDVLKESSNVISKEGYDSDDSHSPVTLTLNESSQFEGTDGAVMENDVSQHHSRTVIESRTDSQLNKDDAKLPRRPLRLDVSFLTEDIIYIFSNF